MLTLLRPGGDIVMGKCWTLDAGDMFAARAARKEATAALAALTSASDVLAAVELIIGELLSNAARHADGKVCLELGRVDGHVEISVHDASTAFALEIAAPPDATSESGRGLYIISKLAKRIDVEPFTGIGKRVSVMLEIPVSDASDVLLHCSRAWLRHESGVCMAPRVARYTTETAMHGME
jgi:anti-sigma regulatory factor (Ser/Thr protein kinase)